MMSRRVAIVALSCIGMLGRRWCRHGPKDVMSANGTNAKSRQGLETSVVRG
jgi:hypothetical protein